MVTIDDSSRITGFREKTTGTGSGFMNTGVYIFSKKVLSLIPRQRPYSLEDRFFPEVAGRLYLYGFIAEGRFLDIGTPRRYESAGSFLSTEFLNDLNT